MTAVVFDPVAFKARYPEFAAVSNATLQEYFTEATLYLSNSDISLVTDLTKRALLLNMLTAHVGALAGALSADGLPLPVGRMSNGAEGSVSAAFEYMAPGSHSWFSQTQYGAAYWRAVAPYRLFRYRSQPTTWR